MSPEAQVPDHLAPLRGKLFPAKPFRPDNGLELGGFLAFFLGMITVGAVLGVAAQYVSQWFYLIIMFPIGIGVGLGAVGSRIAKQTKLRNPIVCGVAGCLAGFIAMAAMHIFGYVQFQRNYAQMAPEVHQLVEAPEEDIDQALAASTQAERDSIKAFARKVKGSDTFFHYMMAQAQEGVSIRSAGHGGEGANLGFVGTWIYWAVEVLIVAAVAFLITRDAASQPFCTQCASWKRKEPLGTFQKAGKELAAATISGSFSQLIACGPSSGPGVAIGSIFTCQGCKTAAPLELYVEEIRLKKKKQTELKKLACATYPGSSMGDMRALFAAPKTPPPADGSRRDVTA